MAKSPVSNLGCHPLNVDHCPFQHLFQFCFSQSDRSLQLWCLPTTKGSADATLFTPTWINSALCAGTLSFYNRNFFQAIEGIDVSNTFTSYRDRKARALSFSSRKHLTPCLENTVKRYTKIAPTFTRTPTNTNQPTQLFLLTKLDTLKKELQNLRKM